MRGGGRERRRGPKKSLFRAALLSERHQTEAIAWITSIVNGLGHIEELIGEHSARIGEIRVVRQSRAR